MNQRKLQKLIRRLKHLPRNRYFILYTTNKIRHYFLKIVRSKKVAYPSNIMIELTNHCNLHCTTCAREYEFGKNMDKGFMPLEEAKKIIDELWPYLDSVGLTGMGETFMYKEMEEIVDYIHSKNEGIIISLSTNAMLPNFIEKVTPVIDKVDTIQISIDGIEEVYEKIRLHASFKQFCKNIKEISALAKGTRSSVMFNVVVTKENYKQMLDLAKFAAANKINFINFNLFNLCAVTNIEKDYYQFFQSNSFVDEMKKLEVFKNENKFVEITSWDIQSKNEFKKCPFPWSHFYISWDGYVVPCCVKPFPKELHFGNVNELGVMNTLNSQEFQTFRKKWFENSAPQFCNKCQFIDLAPALLN